MKEIKLLSHMSITNLEAVDAISIDLMGNAVLTIADDLLWDNGNEHLFTLQSKINAYLEFIESGNLFQKYPDAEGRSIVINIASKYEPNNNAKEFLNRVRQILESSGYGFHFEVLK